LILREDKMALFENKTKKEIEALRAEVAALKAEQLKFPAWLLETAEVQKYNMPDASAYENQADLYRTLSWVMTPIDITALTGALVPFTVSTIVKGKEPKEILNHEFVLKLQRPNELDSRFEFLYATIAYYRLTGNCYWWLNRESKDAPPEEMWIIPPHMIEPIPNGKMYLDGYLYSPGNGNEVPLETHEIVEFKRFNPFNRFRGLSGVESIAMAARGDVGMQEYNVKLFNERGGTLPGILAFDNMIDDTQWEKIKRDKRSAASKREDMMLRGVGQGGVKWLQNTISQRDMEFLSGRKFNRSEIFTALAPGLESMIDPSATEANANAGERTFMGKVVYPMQAMMAEAITNSILPAYGDGLVGAFEDVRISDRQLELQERAADEKIMTIDELRREYKKADPMGDKRGDLLVAQVTAGAAETEEPEPETIQGQEPTAEDEPANNALKSELQKWQRKAIKKIGKAVEFESDVIPASLSAVILPQLRACKSDPDVRALFGKYIETSTAAPKYGSEIILLAQALNRAAEAVIAKPAE
jgi:phage portal protein BeeE